MLFYSSCRPCGIQAVSHLLFLTKIVRFVFVYNKFNLFYTKNDNKVMLAVSGLTLSRCRHCILALLICMQRLSCPAVS